MLKRIISLFLAFTAGIYWYDKLVNTEAFKNAPFGERTGMFKYSDFVASAKVGKNAGEEIANRFWSKYP